MSNEKKRIVVVEFEVMGLGNAAEFEVPDGVDSVEHGKEMAKKMEKNKMISRIAKLKVNKIYEKESVSA